MNFFPNVLRAEEEASLMSAAAMLAQQKAAEIRRDNFSFNLAIPLTSIIAQRDAPTEPIPFPREPRLAYSFNGRSLLDPVDDPDNVADDFNVPRVIVMRYDSKITPTAANPGEWDIFAEFRFDGGP